MKGETFPLRLKLYEGFASVKTTCIFGHVLRTEHPEDEIITKNPFKNALTMIRRYRVKTTSGVQVVLHHSSGIVEQPVDDKGFFFFKVPTFEQQGRVRGEIGVLGYPDLRESFDIPIQNPPEVVISDVDDTILVSRATRPLRKIYLLLTKNHESRKAFGDVQDLYARLHGSHKDNAFFYVSSSEWNLYLFLKAFVLHNELPNGSFLLQDIQSGIRDLLKSGGGSHAHKEDKIRLLLEVFPNAKFILIGDSGQRDPMIYRNIVRTCPDRVKCIYIRDVRKSSKGVVEEMSKELSSVRVPFIVLPKQP